MNVSPASVSFARRGNEGEVVVVIADDFTGAAELSGIGVRHGLHVALDTAMPYDHQAELLVISSDSRSYKQQQAINITSQVTDAVLAVHPSLVYKKTDSAMRGHIVAELNVHIQKLGFKRAVFIPANPALNRTIVDGVYYVNGVPIAETSFKHDPEFPIQSSKVKEVLGDVVVVKHTDELPSTGIIVGEAATIADMDAWAAKVNLRDTFVAGASGFFYALLRLTKPVRISITQPSQNKGSTLFVCGTTFAKSREAISEIKRNKGPVSYMPSTIINDDIAPFDFWVEEVAGLLQQYGKAIIAIDEVSTSEANITAELLRQKTAVMVQTLLQRQAISELIVEGGSTAAAILQRMNWHHFTPVQELMPGVVKMQIKEQPDLYLTVKPGSYQWPDGLWNF